MAQRGKPAPAAPPAGFDGLDPGADIIVDHLGTEPDGRIARADEHLIYLLLIDQTEDMPNAGAYKSKDPGNRDSVLAHAMEGLETLFNARFDSELAKALWRATLSVKG